MIRHIERYKSGIPLMKTLIHAGSISTEALPIDKAIGDNVFCGTINRFGAIDITATKVGENSSLQKLIRMVREAEDKKAPMQRILPKVKVPVLSKAIVSTFPIFSSASPDLIITPCFVACPIAAIKNRKNVLWK